MTKGREGYEILLDATILLVYLINKNSDILYGILPRPFMRNHFNDLLAGCLFPSYVNIVLRTARFDYQIDSLLSVLITEMVCSLFWEVLAPLYLARSTCDPIDVICYILGGMLYLMFILIVSNRRDCQQ